MVTRQVRTSYWNSVKTFVLSRFITRSAFATYAGGSCDRGLRSEVRFLDDPASLHLVAVLSYNQAYTPKSTSASSLRGHTRLGWSPPGKAHKTGFIQR